LSSIGGFAGWLLSNDFLETDVMAGMYLNIDRDKRTRIPFTSDQLARGKFESVPRDRKDWYD
jgi:hypothetical protein